jgi:threonyl-tRNA synthetase
VLLQRDHRIVGEHHELFFFHPLSPGAAFFLPHGAHIYNKLISYIKGEYRRRQYVPLPCLCAFSGVCLTAALRRAMLQLH